MRGYVAKKGGRWYPVLDLGRKKAQRCERCRRNVWVDREPLETCPNCGAALGEVREVRRKVWHRGFRRKKDAEAYRDDLLPRARNGLQPTAVDVETYLRSWLDGLEASDSLKASTLAGYRRHVEEYLIPALGSFRLNEVGKENIEGLYARLRKDLSPTTVRRVHSTLRKALNDAVAGNRLAWNPAAKARLPRASKVEMRFWTPEEVSRFLAHVEDDPHRALWTFLLNSGVRRGEALGLKWTDLDLQAGRVTIRRSAGFYGVDTPKSGKSRSFAIGPSMVRTLIEHRNRTVTSMGGWVFTKPNGEPLSPGSVSHLFNALVEKAGLPTIRLHDLRHTHVVLGLRNGVRLETISRRLGHHSMAFTMDAYGHLLQETDEEAAAAVDF